MEILAENSVNFKAIYCAMNNFRIENAKNKLSEILNQISENKNINYIGELNKNDIMF